MLTLQLAIALLSTLGFSFVLKDYFASFIAGWILKRVKQIKKGVRIKILTNPTIKGESFYKDVITDEAVAYVEAEKFSNNDC